MKEWLEYEIELTPSDNTDQLFSEEKEIIQKLHTEMNGNSFFWNGYYGNDYHRLRWGVKTDKCILAKLKTLLPDHDINIRDPLQDSWAENDDFYNRVSEIKAYACLTVVRLFNFEPKYNWHEMSLYFHYLMNCLGFTYLEETRAFTRNAYECISQIPHKLSKRETVENV